MKHVKNHSTLAHNLRNAEHFDFYSHIRDTINEQTEDIELISPLWKVFLRMFEKENIVFKQNPVAVETKYVYEAKRERYDVYMMIRKRVESASYSFISEEREAAEKLMNVTENHKEIATAGMNTASALIHSMIRKLKNHQYSTEAKIVGISGMVDKLKEMNDKFRNIYKERSINMEANSLKGTMEEVRPMVDKAFKSFTEGVDTLYGVSRLSGRPNEPNPYAKIVKDLNATIDQFARVYARRQASAKGDE
ncbi:MAG: DUF6261 family protein [Tannerellaceae bacterium]|jgi:tryptophan synthase beta subunit|nr:DUF6261 family protein [Tannerellaceae bacterium]